MKGSFLEYGWLASAFGNGLARVDFSRDFTRFSSCLNSAGKPHQVTCGKAVANRTHSKITVNRGKSTVGFCRILWDSAERNTWQDDCAPLFPDASRGVVNKFAFTEKNTCSLA